MRLSCLKSPQGRQLPSVLCTMCSGDAQQLLERRMMPCFSSFAKAARAASCFSGSNRRKRAVTGRPLVMSWCSTSCVGGGRSPAGLRTSWKSTRRPLYAGRDRSHRAVEAVYTYNNNTTLHNFTFGLGRNEIVEMGKEITQLKQNKVPSIVLRGGKNFKRISLMQILSPAR
jgi:hypothetical protein